MSALVAIMKKFGLALGLIIAVTTAGHAEGTQVEYGPNDVAAIVAAHKQDEARFTKEFSGKTFFGAIPFLNAQSSLVGGYYIALSSGSVLCEYVHASDIEEASHWNRGDQIQVKGTIDDVTQGTLILKGCSFLKSLVAK